MRRAGILFTVAFVGFAACSDGGAGNPAPVERDGGPMTTALALVPDAGDESAVVVVNDYAAAGEALGLERPRPEEADEDSVADWFIPLTVGREDVEPSGLQLGNLLGNGFVEDEAWRDELGWAPVDVDLAVEVAEGDGFGYSAVTGDFDADVIDEAVTNEDNVWADLLQTEEQGDVEYYRWEEPEELADYVTVVRPAAQASSMAVLDGAVLWSRDADLIEDGIDAATGETDSLADHEELAPLAEAMDRVEAMGAAFAIDEDLAADPELVAEEDDSDGPTLEPYEAFAIGVRTGEDGSQLLVALLHEDDDAAEDNVENLEEVVEDGQSLVTNTDWSELVSVDEIEVDGPTLTAVLDVDGDRDPGLWLNLLFTRDTLLNT